MKCQASYHSQSIAQHEQLQVGWATVQALKCSFNSQADYGSDRPNDHIWDGPLSIASERQNGSPDQRGHIGDGQGWGYSLGRAASRGTKSHCRAC